MIRNTMARSWAYIKRRLKSRVAVIRLVLALLMLVASLVSYSMYQVEADASRGFEELGVSDAITAGQEAEIHFTAGHKYFAIHVPVVPQPGAQSGLGAALYNEEGELLLQKEFPHRMLQALENTLELEVDGLARGESYRLVLTGLGAEDEPGYCLVLGGYAQTEVHALVLGGRQIGLPQVGLLYHSYSGAKMLLPICCVLALLALALVPPFTGKRAGMFAVLLLVLAPAALVYMVEAMTPFANGEIAPWAWVMNYAIYLFVVLLAFVASNRLAVALGAGGGLLVVGGIINSYTMLFRGTVVLPADLYAAGTALDVLGTYRLVVPPAVYVAVFCLLLGISVSLGNPFRLRGRRVRLGAALVMVAYCAGLVGLGALPKQSAEMLGLGMDPYRQEENATANGFYLNFVLHLRTLFQQKPGGYSVAALQGGLQEYGQMADVGGVQPHIIVIMNESLTDLNYYAGLETTENPLPFISSLREDDSAFVGNAVVSVFGGNTSASEFEFITGFSSALSYNDKAPLYMYVKGETPSIARGLGQLGYTSVGMHPAAASNWNRENAYPLMGFNEAHFLQDYLDMGVDGRLRDWISDEADYEYLIRRFEESGTGEPLFVYNITMQNHGGYAIEGFDEEVFATNLEGYYPQLEQYLTLVKYSDAAFAKLLAYFEACDEPVLVLMFGDHWPSFGDGADVALEEMLEGRHAQPELVQHMTPYVVWSNYGADLSALPETLSLNYLGPWLKQVAGISHTPFERFLLELSKDYPVLSQNGILDATGNFYEVEDYSRVSPLFVQYDALEYNGWFDLKNRVEDWYFYSINE